MNFLHPFSRYGLALVMLKEDLNSVESITPAILSKYIEDGLNHFRIKSNNNPKEDNELQFQYISKEEIDNGISIKAKDGVYLTANIITDDHKSGNSWRTISELLKKLNDPNVSLSNSENITMGITPIAGELNNGKRTKTNSRGSMLEAACCAITNTTATKPYLAYRSKKGSYISTTIIPDLELNEMKIFINFYNSMLISNVGNLLIKKVFIRGDTVPEWSKLRPEIYYGNFPYAPRNHAFGVLGLLGAIGRWAKEADKIKEGQEILESLKDKPLYIIQYGNAQSVTINHYIIDLAKDNKLSDIVLAIQKSQVIHSFDEKDPKDAKGIESKKDIFNLFSSRFLQLFNLYTFKDFLSIRAEYSDTLIELFNTFFIKQMNIKTETVKSAKSLGLWLNSIAYRVGKQEAENQKKADKVRDFKAKILVELESSVFGARNPAEMLNVIVRAGRLSGLDAPAESDIFQEAVLTGEITLNDAKSMLMAFARTRSKQEKVEASVVSTPDVMPDEDTYPEIDVTE
jgi:hypothetical protein